MKVEITEAQLTAIVNSANTLSSMVGSYDQDFNNEIKHDIRLIDRFLNKNGYKRKYN